MDRNAGNFQHLPAHLRTVPGSASPQDQYDPGTIYQAQPPWMLPTWYPSSGNYPNPLRMDDTSKQGEDLSPRKPKTDTKDGKARSQDEPHDTTGTDLTILQDKSLESNDMRFQSLNEKAPYDTNKEVASLMVDKPIDIHMTPQLLPPLSICLDKSYGRWKVAQFIFGTEDQEFAMHLLDVHDKYCERCKRQSPITASPSSVHDDGPFGTKSADLDIGTDVPPADTAAQTGSTAGQCTVCSHGFADEAAFREHMLSHNPEIVSPDKNPKDDDAKTLKGSKRRKRTPRKVYVRNKKESNENEEEDAEDKKPPEEKKKVERKSIRKRKRTPKGPPTAEMIVKMKFRTCRFCVKIFPSLKLMKKHMRNHIKDANFPCEFCNKKFSEQRYLKQHMAKHTGTLYRCDVCGCGFTHRSNLSRHKLIHTGQKRHMCDTCGKQFTQKNDLEAHRYSHTGEKRYRCDVCDKAFTYSSCLRKHKKIHSDVRAYMCDTCGKSFKFSSKLNQHTRTHIKEINKGLETAGGSGNTGLSKVRGGSVGPLLPYIGSSGTHLNTMASSGVTDFGSNVHTSNMGSPMPTMASSVGHVGNMASPMSNYATAMGHSAIMDSPMPGTSVAHATNVGVPMGHMPGVGTATMPMPNVGPPLAHLSNMGPPMAHVPNMTNI